MNTRKSEIKEERQGNLNRIEALRHKLSIETGELKTEIESMKLELMTKYAAGIALSVSAITILLIKLL
jgi:hypothetical protein